MMRPPRQTAGSAPGTDLKCEPGVYSQVSKPSLSPPRHNSDSVEETRDR